LFSDDTVIPFEKLKEEAIKHAIKLQTVILLRLQRSPAWRATIYRLMEKYNIEHGSEE